MLTIIAGALAALVSVPPPPPLPPPFAKKSDKVASLLASRVSAEFKRCGDARTNSNGRYVEAMGTARHSAHWVKASVAMNNALTACRGLRRALRSQNDFLLGLIQSGTKQDVRAATIRLDSVSSELAALEKYFGTETLEYRHLVTFGWGNPHCVAGPLERLVPPASVCPKASGATPR